MEKGKKFLNMATMSAIALDILFILFGLYLLLMPTLSAKVIGYFIGVLLIISGIYAVIKFIIKVGGSRLFILEMVYGVISVIVGVFLMMNPISLSNIVGICLGIWMVLSSTFKAAIALQFRKFKEETWVINFIISILLFIIGLLVIFNPFASYIVIATYIGVMIIVSCSSDILQQILFRKRIKEIANILFK